MKCPCNICKHPCTKNDEPCKACLKYQEACEAEWAQTQAEAEAKAEAQAAYEAEAEAAAMAEMEAMYDEGGPY